MIPAEEQAQRRTALRALLAKPLLVADADGETLVLVRRHLTALRDWLDRETGWRLVVDSETARLFKTAPVLSDAIPPPDCQMPAATLLPFAATHSDADGEVVEMLAIQPL